MEKYLIVGLGNPGLDYENTRHNAGFMVIDKICSRLNVQLENNKFNGLFTKVNIANKQVFLAKPTTYMNLSGEFISRLLSFFDIPIKNILVIYDDVDTEVGKIKLRMKGSSGGQNGIKSIINLLKTDEFNRIRIGIGRDKNIPLDKYVLSSFKPKEHNDIQQALNIAANASIESIGDRFEKIMNKYN